MRKERRREEEEREEEEERQGSWGDMDEGACRCEQSRYVPGHLLGVHKAGQQAGRRPTGCGPGLPSTCSAYTTPIALLGVGDADRVSSASLKPRLQYFYNFFKTRILSGKE